MLIDQLLEFVTMDLLWHLCDIFFLRSPLLIASGESALNEILDWVEQHIMGTGVPFRLYPALTAVCLCGSCRADGSFLNGAR